MSVDLSLLKRPRLAKEDFLLNRSSYRLLPPPSNEYCRISYIANGNNDIHSQNLGTPHLVDVLFALYKKCFILSMSSLSLHTNRVVQ